MDAFNKKEAEEKELTETKPGEKPEASAFAEATADKPEGKEAGREAEPVREETLKEKTLEEIGEIKLTPELRKEAGEEAVKIKELDKEGKVSRLLALAKEKGLVYAINVAKQMNDPYSLDILHDVLIKEGLYKESEK